jgi:hypothetical protein
MARSEYTLKDSANQLMVVFRQKLKESLRMKEDQLLHTTKKKKKKKTGMPDHFWTSVNEVSIHPKL